MPETPYIMCHLSGNVGADERIAWDPTGQGSAFQRPGANHSSSDGPQVCIFAWFILSFICICRHVLEVRADLGELPKLLYLGCDIDVLYIAAIERLYYPFGDTYCPKHEYFILVVHVDVKSSFGVDSPVPLGLALKHAGSLRLSLQFDYQVFEQVWYFRRSAFLAKGQAAVVFASVPRQMGKELKEQLRYMWGVSCGVAVGVRHFDHEFDAITAVEEDLNYFQLQPP